MTRAARPSGHTIVRIGRLGRIGAVGLLLLAACLHGPGVAPSATLAPSGPDSGSARTRGPFAVVYAAPRGHVMDRRQPGVTVLFSRGARSVDTPDDVGVPAIDIRTTTGGAVPGTWRWTGTRGLLFTPVGELPGGSDFVVTVPAGTKSLDGAVLERPYTLEFDTDGPRVLAMNAVGPKGITEDALPPDAVFRVAFDQPVDPRAVEAAASVRVYGADGDRGETLRVSASAEPPRSKRPEDANAVLLKPERPLGLDKNVEIVLTDKLRGTGGPRAMGTPFSRTMRMHGPLRLVDFYCPRITNNGRCRAGGDLKVTLSTPVDPKELKEHLKAKIPPRPPTKGEIRRIDPAKVQWLGFAPKLGADYKVTLTAGMRDIYGQKLEKDASFDIQVEAPLVKPAAAPPPPPAPPAPAAAPPPPPPPSASGTVDLRPRRERLPYQIDLGITGHVLEAGGAHKVPVGTVNVPTYASIATPLSEGQAASWMTARGSDFVTRNGLVATWTTNHEPENVRQVDFLDLDAALAPKHGRGPMLLALLPPGSSPAAETLVNVTDLGVTAKLGPFGGVVWVTQLSTGKPAAGATVAIQTRKDGVVFQGTADAQGLVTVPVDRFNPVLQPKGQTYATIRDDAVIVARSGEDWTVTKVERSQAGWRVTSNLESLSKEGHWAGMLFADRGIFRPGETAKVSGIVRVIEPQGLRSVAGRELRIELRDHNSEQIFDGRAKCDDFGTFAVDVPIPKTAELGPATLTATAPPGGRSNTSEEGVFSSPIRILAFKPNEFKVAAEADKTAYIRGETATFSVTGEYLYGAPMSGAEVTTTASRQEVPFEVPGSEGFTTTDEAFSGDYAETTKAASEADSGGGKLDDKGRFTRKVELSFDDQTKTERVLFDADVQDMSRREVSARVGVIVHPAEFYVGLRQLKNRFVAVGAPVHADVVALEPAGARRAGVKVQVELVERKWNGVTREQPDGTAAKSTAPQDVVLGSCEATTTRDAAGCDVNVPHAGYLVLRATAKDARGNTVRASTSLYGTEDSPSAQTAWPADDRHAVKLETNKKQYEIGETAKVLVRNPFREADALVTVERNGVMWQRVIPIKGPLPVVEIPVQPEYYPNAFVSVAVVRGRIQPVPATGADLGGPEFRFGYVRLDVNPEAHRLKVNVRANKAEYQPGESVDADVVVTDAAGRPSASALTFYVVDEGVLALTSYQTPDPLPSFVLERKLSVFALDNRESLARILSMKDGQKVPWLGYEYALARSGGYDKGDNGGDGDAPKRADFRTTAYFEAGRKTDADGRAHFHFKLPDNLTTFRVMAVAAAGDDRFGSGDAKVTTFRRLMARPALPRLIRVGDALEASVIVSSKPDPAAGEGRLHVEVKMAAKGLVPKGPLTQSIDMARGGQAEVRFPVAAPAPGEATIEFDVRSGADADKVEMKRQVVLPVSVESAVVYGETTDEATIALGDLRAMRPDRGGLDVRVAPTALVGLGTTFDSLFQYPYGCTEQLVSSTLPLLSMIDLAKEFGARLPPDINGAIDGGIEKILKHQGDDGGFGFWDGSSSEPWLSAYAMLALEGASDKKRFVPSDAISRGHEYLNAALASATRSFAKHDDDDTTQPDADAGAAAVEALEKKAVESKTDYANGALVGDVLATLAWANPGALNVLYDARQGQRLFAQALLLHAMAKADMSPAQQKTLMHEIEGRLRVGANEVDVDEPDTDKYSSVLDSHARTLAMVLRGLLAAEPKHPLASRIARKLLGLRRDGAWRTTQENAWALLALSDYRKVEATGGDGFVAKTFVRGEELLKSPFTPESTREDRLFVGAPKLAGESGGLIGFEVSGKGTLFYAADLEYATTTLPTHARDEGLFVQKYVRGVDPQLLAQALTRIPKKTADAVTAGDLVIVDLLFESAEPRDQVVLDDPLPAGLEALDYDLDTTSQAKRDAEEKQRADAEARGDTWLGTTYRSASSRREVHDNRVLTFFDHIEPGMYRVHYLARATSVGTFVTPPTRVSAMYVPEVYGITAASTLSVKPKP